MRPLLLLDVDGTLSPRAATNDNRPAGFVEHRMRLTELGWRTPFRIWLNPAHGPALLALADRIDAQLAWATSWEHRANRLIAPAIGLPTLPVIEFPAGLEPLPGRPFAWKFDAVARFAGDRPLAWLDDDFDLFPDARDAFLDGRRGRTTELVRVDPRTGITDDHLHAIATAWTG
jgi:hypothetical protein